MVKSVLLTAAVCLIGSSIHTLAAEADFNLTYHVERIPASDLSIETCGSVVEKIGEGVGFSASVQSFPGQLVTVSGGLPGKGTFIVQCITVNKTTVSVVQGLDYQQQKGSLGDFADHAFAAVKGAVK